MHKNTTTFFLSVLLILALSLLTACGTAQEDAPTSGYTLADKATDDYTLGELQDAFLACLAEQSIDLKLGTQEYYDFITEQLIYGSNETLKQHPHYDLLHAYMVEYKVAIEDYYFMHPKVHHTPSDDMFYNTNAFRNKTIREIKKENL